MTVTTNYLVTGNGITGSTANAVQALVSEGGILVPSSRSALASDNGQTLELANGVTYTLTNAVALPAGVTLMGPASGSATIACAGTATINGGTSSVSVAAGTVYAAVPRPSSAIAFVVKGS